MRQGTYTTIDCPCVSGLNLEEQAEDKKCQELIVEAFKFLTEEFSKIEGRVRKVSNPHDFGSYPSFEIDYPHHLDNFDEDDDEEADLTAEIDKWHSDAILIEDEYSKKFRKYL